LEYFPHLSDRFCPFESFVNIGEFLDHGRLSMPGLHTKHPDSEKLTAFGLGRLSEADSKDIEQHLADCADCRTTLDNMPGDSLVNLLQASASDTQAGVNLSSPSSDTDSSSLSKESIPPLYKKLAQIIGGKPESGKTSSPKEAPAATLNAKPGFTIPRELEGHARYLVLEPLGAGGMGTVYKAQHRLMERVVALKIVNQLLVTKPGAVERFTREVKAAAQLVHPNIVTAFDAEKVGEMHLLVMEYVEGRTLAQVIIDERELSVAKACDYVRQTALGLQYALGRGMVHRDIKPQNLMLQASPDASAPGVVKILDFGLARFVSEQAQSDGSTEHGSLMGSPDYMAPEQAHDAHTADQRADIYSMGCTLYQLLAGQVPFPEASLLAKLEAHRDKQPIPLNHLRIDVPAELAKVVEKMMAKDPAQRYQAPAEVAAALAPFTHTNYAAPKAQGQPSLGLTERSSRKPTWAMAVAACLLFLGLGYWITQIVFRVETAEGTLIIKTNDPTLEISVKKGGKEVVLIFTKEKKEIPLKVGEYTIELVKGKDGLKLATNSFRIESGKGKTVEVEFVPAVAELTKPPAALAFPFTPEEGKASQKRWAEHLQRKVFETNSVGMKLALIPPGEFPMTPEYRVRLTKPYYLGVHEVTVGQFRQFVKETGHKTDSEANGGLVYDEKQLVGQKKEYIWSNRDFSPTDDHPVVFVSWNDAVKFCAWLSLKEKKNYRLPTVAEGEWASRGGTARDLKTMSAKAWFAAKAETRSQPVGKLPADVFGLFDMFGNVHEHCQDWHGPNPKGLLTDPQGATEGQHRVQRGGSFLHTPEEYSEPASDLRIHFPNTGTNGGGFRVVCEIAPPEAKPADPTPTLPTVEELLKTREILTVAQDGTGAFKTIQAALDKVQANQVIHVKDKGPYRELLRKELPANVAMISKVGTRIEVPKYEAYGEAPEKGKFWYKGSMLTAQEGFHLSGFELTGSHERPADLFGGMMFHLVVAGDVIVENCSLQGPTFMTSITIMGVGKPARVLAQDNLANQGLEFHPFPGTLTIQRNWITNAHAALYLNQNNGSCIVRHNIFQSDRGILYHLRTQEEKIGTDSVDLHIHNNVIETANGPIVFNQLVRDNCLLPRSARIVNNVIRSRDGAGIVGPAEIAKALKDICVIGPNAYQDEPKALGALPLIAKGAGNVIVSKHFLSVEPAQANFFRIVADGPLAANGSGKDLPTYFGAFPPGPAPKDGDWFTRLQDIAKLSSAPPPAKPPFAWPADALRAGHITAPDLSKAKVLYKDKFDDPKSGWHQGKQENAYEAGYANGKYFVAVPPGGDRYNWTDSGPFPDFAVEAVGRVTKSTAGQWLLGIMNIGQRTIHFRLNGEGELEIEAADWFPAKWRPLGRFRHNAIKPGEAFNKLLLVVRGQRIEVYVNDVAVCDPIISDVKLPAQFLLGAYSQKNQAVRAEFERITVWSAEGLPTPEERLKKGEVPVKAASPPSVKDLLAKAKAATDAKQFEQAISHCNEVLSKDPKNIEAIYLRAWPQWNLGKREEAIQDVTAVLKMDTEHQDARNKRAFYYLNTGRPDECIADCDEFEKRDKTSAAAALNLGSRGGAWAHKGRFEKGLADFEAATKIDFSYATAYHWQGIILERLGEHAKAKVAYDNALKLDKSFATYGKDRLDHIIPLPTPLAEWRKGREFITVAQNGPADYRTIHEALNALKTGQYVKVLDKGPYREIILHNREIADIALVSDVGTRIEVPKWHEWGPSIADKKKKIYQGFLFVSPNGLRLSGFEFRLPPVPADAENAVAVDLASTGDLVAESCQVRYHRDVLAELSDEDKQQLGRFIGLNMGLNSQGTVKTGRFLVQDNLIDGKVAFVGNGPVLVTVQRNWIRADDRQHGTSLLRPVGKHGSAQCHSGRQRDRHALARIRKSRRQCGPVCDCQQRHQCRPLPRLGFSGRGSSGERSPGPADCVPGGYHSEQHHSIAVGFRPGIAR
jgi:formylglycine-generating enzyme required for sulfatase activity/tetratricopeptide (TPR) repeat protein